MVLLPIQTADHKHDMIVVVLGKDNLARMKEADPAEIELSKTGRHLVNPTVVLCYEDANPTLNRLIHGSDLMAILKYLKRGWKFQPEKGDHDRGPESLHNQN